jgi:predicted Zn-dependent protease
LARAGKYDEAIESFNQLIQQFPRDAQVRDELGQLYLRQGKRAQAQELFDQALAIDPKDEVARRNRAQTPGKEPDTLPVPARK